MSDVVLTWNPVDTDDTGAPLTVEEYRVREGGTIIATIVPPTTTATLTNVTPGSHTYEVSAWNQQNASEGLAASVTEVVPSGVPAQVTGLIAAVVG